MTLEPFYIRVVPFLQVGVYLLACGLAGGREKPSREKDALAQKKTGSARSRQTEAGQSLAPTDHPQGESNPWEFAPPEGGIPKSALTVSVGRGKGRISW